jgi:hypothetical protein
MTNFEYFKNEIIDIIKHSGHTKPAVDRRTGKPCKCDGFNCKECVFIDNCNMANYYNWGTSEHVEKPELTKKERQFCELVETGWIARDDNDVLFWYEAKPNKGNTMWTSTPYGNYHRLDNKLFSHVNCKFSFITWNDNEPWSIEDLLKLKVLE